MALMDIMKMRLKIICILLGVACVLSPFSHVWANGEVDPLSIVSDAERAIFDGAPHKTEKSGSIDPHRVEKKVSQAIQKEKSAKEYIGYTPPSFFDEEMGDAYVIGPSDKLRVTIYGEKDLSKVYKVDGLGVVSVPLIGQIKVAGITLRQAEQLLVLALSDGYLVDPSVAIEIAEFRPFYIMGEVRRPGSYNYIDGMSVLNAVAVSGGFTYRANTKNIEVIRGNAQGDVSKVPPTAQVLPGDIIRVKERFF